MLVKHLIRLLTSEPIPGIDEDHHRRIQVGIWQTIDESGALLSVHSLGWYRREWGSDVFRVDDQQPRSLEWIGPYRTPQEVIEAVNRLPATFELIKVNALKETLEVRGIAA